MDIIREVTCKSPLGVKGLSLGYFVSRVWKLVNGLPCFLHLWQEQGFFFFFFFDIAFSVPP